jgi:hypothetical protein
MGDAGQEPPLIRSELIVIQKRRPASLYSCYIPVAEALSAWKESTGMGWIKKMMKAELKTSGF